jgi:hypothetical protein
MPIRGPVARAAAARPAEAGAPSARSVSQLAIPTPGGVESVVNELVAVLVAIAGAITFGASDVIEQRATHKVAKRPPLDFKLFADLAANKPAR